MNTIDEVTDTIDEVTDTVNETVSNSNETPMEIPVLELEFSKVIELCKKINIVDSVTYYSMPDHVKKYENREQYSIDVLINELIGYQTDENKWRLREDKVIDFQCGDDYLKVGDKTIYDSSRIIIISKINSIYIIPGERSIAEGNCTPNEIIRLSNLISSQFYLLRFNDVENEDKTGYDLKVDYMVIDRDKIQ
jgi:hypothetical protein